MEQYIPKDAVVAEIENRIKKYILLQQKPEMSDLQQELQNKIDCLNSIKGYILNTFEVKEVDLDKEFEQFLDKIEGVPRMWHSDEQIEWAKDIAKYFFELGLKAQKGE